MFPKILLEALLVYYALKGPHQANFSSITKKFLSNFNIKKGETYKKHFNYLAFQS
jgi:hypothetical protein